MYIFRSKNVGSPLVGTLCDGMGYKREDETPVPSVCRENAMERHILADLQNWKERPDRKPLVLRGARQVGKTWALQEFGKRCFEDCAYVRLEDNAPAAALFEGSLEPSRLIEGLSALARKPIIAGKTLLILDEVQSVPRALTALKYFCEDAPEYCIAVAGSLLGVALHTSISFPVGKVDFLDLYPMSFTEYLEAAGERDLLAFLQSSNLDMVSVFKEAYTDHLKRYYFVGGMPEVVKSFVEQGDFHRARVLQSAIVDAYEADFSKHVPGRDSERCRMVWQSLPRQLAKENKKFIYGTIEKGARGRDFEEAIQILVDSGVVLRVGRIAKPGLPLEAYRDPSAFKLYSLDVGLLGAMSGLDSATIVDGSTLFTEFKGALAEQYVCQQLVSDCGLAPYYWSAEKSSGEVDFVVQRGNDVLPIEVKAEVNLKSKSLASFCRTYGIGRAARLSMSGYERGKWLTNVPLYAMPMLESSL
ncbi:MAG: DUF4143 domain-containing protein [Gordonibacter sp.]